MAGHTTLVPTTCSVGSTGVVSLTVLLSAALVADSAVTNASTRAPSDSVFVHDKPSADRRTLYGQNVTEHQSRINNMLFAQPASVSSDDGGAAPAKALTSPHRRLTLSCGRSPAYRRQLDCARVGPR